MCGIAGIAGKGSLAQKTHLEEMVNNLKHRGPDGLGIWQHEDCLLGHTRLAIVDIEGGKQPMQSYDQKYIISLNGEIYGYKEIKRQLSQYPFQTNSDTEVILALYQQYGSDFIHHLPGMFAFALYDIQKGKLFLARDRFGEKPLHYGFTRSGQLIFASESRPIHKTGLVKSHISVTAIAHFLQHLYVPVNESIYENIHSLPPASIAEYDVNDGDFKITSYWCMPQTRQEVNAQEAIPKLQSLFTQAVQRQMVADVPVGCFLSGGLDSTTVTAIASGMTNRLATYSFGFEDVNSDMPYAREVANKYHTNHTELWDKATNIADLMLQMGEVYDAPFADASAVPTFLISKEASKHMKVVLTGDGADELFAGYGYYYGPLQYFKRQQILPATLKLMWYRALRKSSSLAGKVNEGYSQRVVGTRMSLNHNSLIDAHISRRTYMTDSMLQLLGISPNHHIDEEVRDGVNGTLNDALQYDIKQYLPGDLLVKTDRASMANGLELRSPFLDYEFASFCMQLPYCLKINGESEKLIMRSAFAHLWPDSVKKRTKSGFAPNVDKWMQRREVLQLKTDMFDSNKTILYDFLVRKTVKQMSQSNGWHAWILLTLAIWLEKNR